MQNSWNFMLYGQMYVQFVRVMKMPTSAAFPMMLPTGSRSAPLPQAGPRCAGSAVGAHWRRHRPLEAGDEFVRARSGLWSGLSLPVCEPDEFDNSISQFDFHGN